MRTAHEQALFEHAELLSDILGGRNDGSFDTRAGTADEDLLYAIEEVVSSAPKVAAELKERGA